MYDHPETLTQSKINAFACPSRYHKLHVLGLEDTSDPARRGSTVHTANELYVAGLVQIGASSDFELADQCFHDALVQEHTPAHLVPDCEYLWRNHVEQFELDLEAFLEAETRKTVGRFSFKPDYAYVYPDRLVLNDLKTHYAALTADGAKHDLQARMSVYLASKCWPGFDRYQFVFHFIRLRHRIEVDFVPSELDAIERQLNAHAEAIARATETNNWPACPGVTCAYCAFACDLVDDAARAPARILDAAEAEQMAANLVLLKAAVAAQNRVLESYTALHGPVVAAGHEFAHRPYERKAFPAGATVDLLRERGASIDRITLGTTVLRPYLTTKKFAYLKDDLDALAQVTTGTTFSAKKLSVAGEDAETPEDA